MEGQRGWAPFTHGQLYYSLLGRDIERDFVPLLRRYGLGLTVWSPFAAGFLSGKYTTETLKDADKRLSGFDIFPFNKTEGFKVVDKVRSIAERHHVTPAQVALAWLLAKPTVTSIILGASKLHQLEDNLGAVNVKLDNDEVTELDAITQLPPVYANWFVDRMIDVPARDALQAAR